MACAAADEQGMSLGVTGRTTGMKLLRSAAALGVAKRLYEESQKPENQRRIQEAVQKVKAKREQRRRP
jgi:hypothetical protein